MKVPCVRYHVFCVSLCVLKGLVVTLVCLVDLCVMKGLVVTLVGLVDLCLLSATCSGENKHGNVSILSCHISLVTQSKNLRPAKDQKDSKE